MHGQHLKTMPYKIPLFRQSYKAVPSSPSPNQTIYLLLPKTEADINLFNRSTAHHICPAFSSEDDPHQSTFILLEGQCLGEYLRGNKKNMMTEQQLWKMISCLSEAFIMINNAGYSQYLNHLKEYSVRRIKTNEQISFKLLFHPSQISHIEAAKVKGYRWDQLYCSPQELQGIFISEKSIVFSFGVMILNICSRSQKKIYRQDRISIDWNIVQQKLSYMKDYYRYSNPLLNLVKHCLQENPQDRYDFTSLRCLIQRKLDILYSKQSNVLSRILQLQKQKGKSSLNYQLFFPKGYTTSLQFNSSAHRSSRQKESCLQNSKVKKKSKKFQTKNKSEKSLQKQGEIDERYVSQFNLKNQSIRDDRWGVESRSKDLVQQKQEDLEQYTTMDNKEAIGNSKIQYRGTFGGRIQQKMERSNENSVSPKRYKMVKDEDQLENLKQLKDPKPQIIEHPKVEQNKEKNNNQQIDTPKGFGIFQFPTYNQTAQTHKKYQPQSNRTYHNQYKPSHNNENVTYESQKREQIRTIKKEQYKKTYPLENYQRQSYGRNSMPVLESLIQQIGDINLNQCLKGPSYLRQKIEALQGVGFWAEGDLYFGDFKNGRRNGLGLEIFPNGEYYYGHFVDDLFDAEGFYFWNKDEYFLGKFAIGQKTWGRLDGRGLKYQGGFFENKRNGTGICYYQSGEVYKGQWKDSKRHGTGMLMSEDGDKFVGNWVRGKRKGEGYLQTEFMRITGNWEENSVIGQALIEYSNDDKFNGKIGQNLQKIQGQYISKSGRKFQGYFQDDMPRKGKMIYSNGDIYIGQFVNMKRHGKGEYTYSDSGQIFSGMWANNQRVIQQS